MEGVNGAEWKGARKSFSGLVAGSKGTACSCAGLRFRASLFAATGRALSKSCASFVLLLLLGVLGLILPQLRAEAQTLAGPVVTETRLPPNSLTDLVGTHTGSVTALDTKDQTGTQNDTTKYVQFGVPSGQQYLGYQSFVVPTTISLSQVTSLQLMANVLAPSPSSDAFTWSIYNWSTASYEPVVQVWIREQKELRYPQAWFVESAHGDGDAQAAGEARRFVDRTHGVGSGSGASVLSAVELTAGGRRLRRGCRGVGWGVLFGAV